VSELTEEYGFVAELDDGVITLSDSMGGGTRIYVGDGHTEYYIEAYIKSCARAIAEDMVEHLGLNDVEDEYDDEDDTDDE
jgi:hypothetical protein